MCVWGRFLVLGPSSASRVARGNVVLAMARMGARSDPLAAAEGALARGSWGEARAEFERAIEGGAGPEAYEGLAMAAFFLDEASLVFEARERAYAGSREARRALDASRLAT